MKTTDLRPSQIQRIDRLQMARYQKKKKQSWKVEALTVILFCLWIAACYTISRVNRKPSMELTTSLPANLDEQTASITIRP